MARYHGKKGRLYVSTSGAGVASPVGSLSNWSLDFKTDKAETTSFGDVNKTYVQGLPDVQIQFDGFFDDTTLANLYTSSQSSDGVRAYLYPSTDALLYFYGPAWLDLSFSTPVGDAIKLSGSMVANGAWGAKTS
jgi:hypothetical protein